MPAPALRIAAGALCATALVGFALALGRLRRFERTESPSLPWWFGYARDGVNLGAALLVFVGYALTGLGGPGAFVAAVAAVLGIYTVDWLVGRQLGWRRSAWVASALGVVLAVASVGRLDVTRGAVERLLALATHR